MKKIVLIFCLFTATLIISTNNAFATYTYVQVTSGGYLVTSVSVGLWGWDGSNFVPVVTGSLTDQGYFYLGDLYPGSYRLVITNSAGYSTQYDVTIYDQQQQIIPIGI